jgi:hypothetical protein
MTGKPLTPSMKLRKYNDRCNSTVPKIGLCGKMEAYSSKMGPDDESVLIQFKKMCSSRKV